MPMSVNRCSSYFAEDDPPDCEIESDSMLLNREGNVQIEKIIVTVLH